MIGIAQAQYDEAQDAASRLQEVSDLVRAAAALLINMERRFMMKLEAVDGAEAITDDLATRLSVLGARIALAADNAAERTE
jgi:hypothetical protein